MYKYYRLYIRITDTVLMYKTDYELNLNFDLEYQANFGIPCPIPIFEEQIYVKAHKKHTKRVQINLYAGAAT